MEDLRDHHEEIPLVNTMPPEILAAIFLHAREVRRFKRILPFQVTLSHVCDRWRQVAITTPRLWNTLAVFSSQSMPCLEEWLTRSGAAPIDIRIDIYDSDRMGIIDAAWIEENITMLTARVHQIRSLFIFVYHRATLYRILRLFENAEAPCLQKLCIRTGELTPSVVPNLESTFKSGLPMLSSAEFEPIGYTLPLTHITTLHLVGVGRIYSVHFDQLVEILRSPLKLVNFSLRGCVGRDSWPIHRDSPYIQLPELRSLSLSDVGMTGILFLLTVNAPNLESLRWDVESDNYHLLTSSPQLQCAGSGGKFPLLKYLTLERQILSKSALTRFMEIFPSPTHIFFSYPFHVRGPRSSDFVGLPPAWADLRVLAVRMTSARNNDPFVKEMRNVLPFCPRIEKVLVDAELLSHIQKTAPELKEVIQLEELATCNFPDFWWTHDTEY